MKDNEYSQTGFGQAEYFQELEDTYRAGGVIVPLTYNDPGERMSFINGTVSNLELIIKSLDVPNILI